MFVNEFFDLQDAPQLQTSFIFDKIFKQSLKTYSERLKELVDVQLYDPYSILIMIATAEQCKVQMLDFYRLRVLTSFLEKLLIFALWPRFS